MTDPHIRASDAERAVVAEALGRHLSAGRLTVEEYDERLQRAYAARTRGELEPLTADLPAGSPAGTAVRSDDGAGAPAGGDGPGWRSWAATSVLVTVVWLVTVLTSGGLTYPWPVWVIGPWGAVLLAGVIRGRGQDGDRSRQLPSS